MKTEPTWKDVDAIINLRSTSGSTVSLTELEAALASEDESKIKLILAALRGPTDDYEADLYPFGGVRLTLDIQKRRIKKWYKEGQLVNILYTQALAKAKEKKTAEEAAEAAEEVTEDLLSQHMYTAGLADPDMIVRTGGEFRLSNFLLWQASYAEYYSTPAYWPDFDEAELYKALVAFNQRQRRYGLLPGDE